MSCSNFKLNLPIDIPWKRKCVSTDMMDDKLCDENRPYKWRSSIAVFEYEPDEEFQNYEGMLISYLKISCSITGYQENPKEVGVDYKGVKSYWKNKPGIKNYLDAIQNYYACYGAILEVGVAPKENDISLEKYPYFLNFEPKKRELYELVSDTGETLSRSLSNVEIGKSNTSLKSHEVVDIDKGSSFGISLGIKNVDIGLSGSSSKESGTRDITETNTTKLKTTDTSEEMRETQSHTTQLSQMYHQLDSYHLGTNRAVFFMHPRPHTIETVHTFVNGPRNIEGIQDFMFVVARPKELKEISVEVNLETAHVAKMSAPSTIEEIPDSELTIFKDYEFKAEHKGGDYSVYDNQDKVWDVNDEYTGYEIKSAVLKLGQPAFIGNRKFWGAYPSPNDFVDVVPRISYQDKHLVKISGGIHSWWEVGPMGLIRYASIIYPIQLKVTLAKYKKIENETDVLFLAGRRLCCRPEPKAIIKENRDYSIVYELENPWSNYKLKNPIVKSFETDVAIANQMGLDLKEKLIQSRADIQHRYLKGKVNLPQTQFALKVLSQTVKNNENLKISEIAEITDSIKEKIIAFRDDLTLKDVLTMPIEMQKDLFQLNQNQVIKLRNDLVGINYKYDPKTAWTGEI